MTWPRTEQTTRTLAGGWSVAGNPPIDATLWHVKVAGKSDRYEADVMRSGQLIETLAGATREAVVEQLERRYHSAH